ncbi:uncharacterized protein LOC135847736 isoform X2 [Planococcus citri]|uniref:uncharacterized protein LOC135847736 isoform X2 n=1 Tax=Planococcus citri TaxID=170843 RepID=UPI0031F9E8B2
MEVEQHEELEMAEITSEVYDIIHPTPVSLIQLSAITVSLEVWRRKVNKYRIKGKLEKFDPYYKLERLDTWLKKMLPDLPSMIYQMIEKVLSKFRGSMLSWAINHDRKGFCTDGSNDFDDFVCDYDGCIDYAKTAERMMLWEGFSSEMKFTVACMYFFEDDIRRIWPSVSANLNVGFIDFDKCPQLCYWICRLTNKLDKIPTRRSETVDERMFTECMPYNRPSVEYFWNRIPVEKQVRIAVDELSGYDFVRFVLPKLDDVQLDEFVNDSNSDGLYNVFLNLHSDEWVVLRTWFHIRNVIKETNFTNLIIRMFDVEDYFSVADEHFSPGEWAFLCCQIWKHTPLNLKRSTINVFSSGSSWIAAINIHDCGECDCMKINVDLLLTILQDASLEERNLFLHNCWGCLIKPLQSKDLQRVIELCFENEVEINQFKRNVMVKSGDVFQHCLSLLKDLHFDELNAFVSFCCPKSQAARNFKQRILRSAFLGENCKLGGWIFRRYTSERVSFIQVLNKFVDDAFDDYDISADFKDLFMSSTSFLRRLSSIMCERHITLNELTKFIDTFVSTKEVLTQVKMGLIDSLKGYGTRNAIDRRYVYDLDKILPWCLGSNEGVEEFKLNCSWKSVMR